MVTAIHSMYSRGIWLTSIADDNSDELLLLLLLFVEFELFVEFLGPRGGILLRTLVRLLTVNVFALDGDT